MNIETCFFIVFSIYSVFLCAEMILAYLLFRQLKKNHAAYYKSIGRPIMGAPWPKRTYSEYDFVQDYMRGLRGARFTYGMIFRGIPRSFPKDPSLRRLAIATSLVLAMALVSFLLLVFVAYLFYKSGS